MRTERKDHVILDLDVLGIRKVLDLEELLDLGHTLCGKSNEFVLLVNDKITRLFSLDTHDGIHLGQIFHVLAPL